MTETDTFLQENHNIQHMKCIDNRNEDNEVVITRVVGASTVVNSLALIVANSQLLYALSQDTACSAICFTVHHYKQNSEEFLLGCGIDSTKPMTYSRYSAQELQAPIILNQTEQKILLDQNDSGHFLNTTGAFEVITSYPPV